MVTKIFDRLVLPAVIAFSCVWAAVNPALADGAGWSASIEGGYLMESGEKAKPYHTTDYDPNNFLALSGPYSGGTPDGGAFRSSFGYDFGSWDISAGYSGSWLGDRTRLSVDDGYPFPVYGMPAIVLDRELWGFAFNMTEGAVKEGWSRHVVDLALGVDLLEGDTGHLKVLGGARYANIDHMIEIEGYHLIPTDTAAQSRRDRYEGFGPAIGLAGELNLTEEMSLTGAITGAALFGKRTIRSKGEYHHTLLNLDLYSDEKSTTHKTVWNLGTELGLTYRPAMSDGAPFSVTLGYRLDQWWNIHDTRSERYRDDNNNYIYEGTRGSRNGDATSHGPFLRLGLKF